MRTYDRTLAKVGDTIKINTMYSGESYLIGKEFIVKSIEPVVEEIVHDHIFKGELWSDKEEVNVMVYLIECDEGVNWPIWPYETDMENNNYQNVTKHKHLKVITNG